MLPTVKEALRGPPNISSTIRRCVEKITALNPLLERKMERGKNNFPDCDVGPQKEYILGENCALISRKKALESPPFENVWEGAPGQNFA